MFIIAMIRGSYTEACMLKSIQRLDPQNPELRDWVDKEARRNTWVVWFPLQKDSHQSREAAISPGSDGTAEPTKLDENVVATTRESNLGATIHNQKMRGGYGHLRRTWNWVVGMDRRGREARFCAEMENDVSVGQNAC